MLFNVKVDQSFERERQQMRIAVLDESVKSCELRLEGERGRERRKAASTERATYTADAGLF